MAKKKPGYIDTSKDLVINTALIAGMLSSGGALMSGDSVLPDSVLLAGLLGSAATLINRNLSMPKPRSQSRQLTNMQYSPFGIIPTTSPDPDMASYNAKFKTRPEREFIYVHQKWLNGPVPESVLVSVIKTAHHRQMNAEFGSRLSMLETSTGRLRRLTINQVLSKQYFCKRWSKKLLPTVFDDIITILFITGYLSNGPKMGKAPRFINVRQSPNKIADGCREWWEYLFPVTPPTLQARARFWRVFGN